VLSHAGEGTLPNGCTVDNLRKRNFMNVTQGVCSWTLLLSVSVLHTLQSTWRLD
jgi:hypothetical protein